MKKIILFFSIFCAVFATNTNAQFAACNASFTYNYLTANNIKFVPAVVPVLPVVDHAVVLLFVIMAVVSHFETAEL